MIVLWYILICTGTLLLDAGLSADSIQETENTFFAENVLTNMSVPTVICSHRVHILLIIIIIIIIDND
jgi:hypothetical protein